MKKALWILFVAALQACALEAPPQVAVNVNVRECGAVGDGVADDSAAFQKAFDQAAAAAHATIRIPAGAYRLARRVEMKFAGAVGNGLALIGDGQGVSVVHCANTNGALKVRSELCQTQVTVRDLTLLADIPDAGTALEVSSSARGVRNYRTLTVLNVDMRGAGLPTHNFFSRGLCALAQWRPLFQNVVFAGILDPALKENDIANDALRFKPEYGICADWSYAPSFQHCYAWSCHTGYRVVSRDLKPEGPEDGAFYRCTSVGTRIGIDVDTPGIEPQLVIDACHLNCRDAGVRLHNRKFFNIVNCLFYAQTEDQCAYSDVTLQNCWAGVISGNTFHSPQPSNVKPEPASRRTCIAVDKDSRHILVSGNMFNGKGTALRSEAGAKDIQQVNNQLINPYAIMPRAEAAAAGEKQ